MKRISPTVRIAFCLVCLLVSILLSAESIGMIPDSRAAVMDGRSKLCEAVAINSSLFAARNDINSIEIGLRAIAKRHPDVISMAIRDKDGSFRVQVGDHEKNWQGAAEDHSTETHMYVPIMAGHEMWGRVEMRFKPTREAGVIGFLKSPIILLIIFVSTTSMLGFVFYLRKILKVLDPSQVVPDRVRSALDTMAEGLLVLDKDERIVLANLAFARTADQSPEALQGRKISEFAWKSKDENGGGDAAPWTKVFNDGEAQKGVLLGFNPSGNDERTFIVNSTPILGDDGTKRGVLASFDDVTPLEEKKVELSQMLDKLKASSEEIHRQNKELEILATRDPLTACMNRRSLFEQFETLWKTATRHNHPLCCVMVDIDHFKSINDTHGHSVGDQVLQMVAAVLKTTARDGDIVSRYGGEEFCIVLPHIDLDGAAEAAERYRSAIEAAAFVNINVTASLGVSSIHLGAPDPHALIDQADKCLYAAKENGRNQVVRWDAVPEDIQLDESTPTIEPLDDRPDVAVPFQAVTALISALAYRDLATGEHSRRVADLCVAVAEGLMSVSDCYVLEISALLHDIGKIGVPDSILLKPGPLTREEWRVMETHDKIGVEIIRASFASEGLSGIVENHHAFYGGNARDPELPAGDDIPMGARILTLADSYDAIISDRVYRKGRSPEEAFAELRRCAGTQFDPELVERFIKVVSVRNKTQSVLMPKVSKETALSIGLQIEKLAAALDNRDLSGLQAMAARIKTMATRQGIDEIADKAALLTETGDSDEELLEVLHNANDLLELCRSTQRSYLHDAHEIQTIDQPAAAIADKPVESA